MASCRLQARDEEFRQLLRSVKEELGRQSASPVAQAYVQQVLTEQYQQHSERMASETAKGHALLTYVNGLEARTITESILACMSEACHLLITCSANLFHRSCSILK